jgi:hypothetical protein
MFMPTCSSRCVRAWAWLRETQDKQTGGIPIGPDTSFLVGEIVGTALDLELKSQIPSLRGTRYVDDYHLYFSTVADAEKAPPPVLSNRDDRLLGDEN